MRALLLRRARRGVDLDIDISIYLCISGYLEARHTDNKLGPALDLHLDLDADHDPYPNLRLRPIPRPRLIARIRFKKE